MKCSCSAGEDALGVQDVVDLQPHARPAAERPVEERSSVAKEGVVSGLVVRVSRYDLPT